MIACSTSLHAGLPFSLEPTSSVFAVGLIHRNCYSRSSVFSFFFLFLFFFFFLLNSVVNPKILCYLTYQQCLTELTFLPWNSSFACWIFLTSSTGHFQSLFYILLYSVFLGMSQGFGLFQTSLPKWSYPGMKCCPTSACLWLPHLSPLDQVCMYLFISSPEDKYHESWDFISVHILFSMTKTVSDTWYVLIISHE